jgi:hypothetical protein
MTPQTHRRLVYPYSGSKFHLVFILFLLQGLFPLSAGAQEYRSDSAFARENYRKQEYRITMRDGVRLYTVVYLPVDTSGNYPILMVRTPYSAGPYGVQAYRYSLGPNPELMREKYIFVYQDVRGRYMSEGTFEEMTPHRPVKKGPSDTDESSDTYDTIKWLLENLKHHNGNVGIWGISYPGFYATASLPGAHPSLKAVSPQAPVTDEFIGDDANHKGAFFLLDNFNFLNYFDIPRNGPVEDYGESLFESGNADAYTFFLNLGPLRNTNKPEYFGNRGKIWNELLEHDTYDRYWQSRNIRPHLKKIRPAVLVTGGWFDAEDLFGALETYRAIEKNNPANKNRLVMGPWAHGAWSLRNWNSYATHQFGSNTSAWYQHEIETPFFNYYLKGKGNPNMAEATVFETGTNRWKTYTQWPPPESRPRRYFLHEKGVLNTNPPAGEAAYSSYTSDPAHPVPYTANMTGRRNNDYMAEDQRFAASRPDVLLFETDTLTADLTISGGITAELFASTTGTDADFIVKVIDVLPERISEKDSAGSGTKSGGMQRLVRAEVIRGKFRKDFSKPEPFTPGKPEKITLQLPDAAHCFLKGHRIMVQIQSSWFPLTDRNPQKFMRIPEAREEDFQKAEIRIFHTKRKSSAIILPVMNCP